MKWQCWQLIILSIINLFAGFCFGYLIKNLSHICAIIYVDKEDNCNHEWGLYTDPNRNGRPFVKQCDLCKKTEYYDF